MKEIFDITIIVTLSLVILGAIYLSFYRNEAKKAKRIIILKYSLGAKILIVLIAMIPIGSIILGLCVGAFKAGTDTIIAYIILSISIIAFIFTYIRVFHLQIIITQDEIIKKNIFQKDIRIDFNDIKLFVASNFNTDCRIITENGLILKISDYMNGRVTLFKELEKKIGLEKFQIVFPHKNITNYLVVNQIISGQIKEYAYNAERIAEEKGFILDYSEESIEKVEEILKVYYKSYNESKNPSLKEEMIKTAKTFGAYVGEVIKKNIGGNWEYSGSSIVLKKDESYVFPIDKVYKRLSNGDEDNIYHYYQILKLGEIF